MEDYFEWLQKWYKKQLSTKEYQNVIQIKTVDNPGWYMTINLFGTEYYNKVFSSIDFNLEPDDELNWYFALRRNHNFEASGGPCNLVDLLQIFRSWVENDNIKSEKNLIHYLQNWYLSQCDGDWEHIFGIKIETFNKGWKVKIDLIETIHENKIFNEINKQINENNWLTCDVKNGKFIGNGGAENLTDILQIFIDWINEELEYNKFL